MLSIPRLIIIAGNGRDSGKTTFACRLIQKFSAGIPVVAVKISPHQHMPASQDVDLHPGSFSVEEESDAYGSKDSSRMLAAGAKQSFFVTSHDNKLTEAITHVLGRAGEESYMICESGGLRKYIEPGIFLMVNRKGRNEIKPECQRLADFKHVWITFDGKAFDFDMNRIMISENRWIIKNS